MRIFQSAIITITFGLKRLAELQESARKAGDDKDGGMLKVMQANNQFQSEILKQNLELRKMIAQQNQMIALEKQAEFDKEAKSQAIFKSREVAPLQALRTRSISVNGSGGSSGYKDCGNDLSLGCGL